MGFVTIRRAAIRAALSCLVLLPAAAFAAKANPYASGAAPTAAALDAALGELPVAEAVIDRERAIGFGGGTLYYPVQGKGYAAIAVVPGFTGYQSSLAWIGPKLASHGFVVIVIDTFTTSDQPNLRAKQVLAALEQVKDLNKSKYSPIRGKVDTRRVAVMGHSMGGGAAMLAARERGDLKAVVALTPWTQDKKFETAKVPTLIVACEKDAIAANGTYSQPLYESMPAGLDKAYVELKGQSHFCPQIPINYSLMGRYTIAWMKRFVDNDASYDTFLCGDAHRAIASGDKLSGQRSSCPF